MSAYYYLMCQLPGLAFGADTGTSFADFCELAGRFLTKADARVLNGLSLIPARSQNGGFPKRSGSDTVDAWYHYEVSLRLSLAQLRAASLKKDTAPYVLQDERLSAEAQRAAKQAMTIDNPLEAERFLDFERWKYLDTLGVAHQFDGDAVFLYGLRLLLLERDRRFSDGDGSAAYDTVYNQILNVSGE